MNNRICYYRVLDNPDDPFDYIRLQLRVSFEELEWKKIHDPDLDELYARFRKITKEEYFQRRTDYPESYKKPRMEERWASYLAGARALNLLRQQNEKYNS